ncbi:hypothetical protein BC628DRAFT_1350251 [Trametes gibbosa]|nr:hypothetical protein BC628DRAFT_1350251 [Trametes gibbosa]
MPDDDLGGTDSTSICVRCVRISPDRRRRANSVADTIEDDVCKFTYRAFCPATRRPTWTC